MNHWELLFIPVTAILLLSIPSWREEPPPLEERRLVLDCMTELGWEAATEGTEPAAQLEQSRAWCEDFVRGSRD